MTKTRKLEPKLITVFREGYRLSSLWRDVIAGLVVGVVALPMAIAFAIASGVKPEQGLYTAVIAGFIISLFSGSRVQIGGPTGAFIVVVLDIVTAHGYDGLAVATLLAGGLLLMLGLCRLGAVIKFIPFPVTVGFTSGIAVVIATTQFRDALGLQMGGLPRHFHEKLITYAEHLNTINPWALAITIVSLLIIQFWPRVTSRIPGSLVAILLAAVVVKVFALPVETIGSRFGAVPSALPTPHIPHVSWHQLRELIGPAVAIALLGGIESLLSAVVADGMTGQRHNSNMELVAQGLANLASPIFLGIPATGAIARTATNIRNGGQTPIAGIVHAITLLAIMIAFGRWAELIPMASLAAILLKVSFNMGEWHLVSNLLRRAPRSEVLVLLSTFSLTVFFDLTLAIQVGVVLAAFLFMHRVAEATEVEKLTAWKEDEDEDMPEGSAREIPPGVVVFDINGPFFFAAADRFKDALRAIEKPPKVLLLRMHNVPTMDTTALQAVEDVHNKTRRDGTVLVFSGARSQPRKLMNRAGFIDRIGRENFRFRFDDALDRARAILAQTSSPQSPSPPHA